MNIYARIGSGNMTADAASLTARLSAWHDAMVAHERRLRGGGVSHGCDDECPHAEAPILWAEAQATFGPRATELVFLRSRAIGPPRRQRGGGAGREVLAEAADAAAPPRGSGDQRDAASHARVEPRHKAAEL